MTGTESNSAKQLDKHASQISKRTFQYFFCSSCFITKTVCREANAYIPKSTATPIFSVSHDMVLQHNHRH